LNSLLPKTKVSQPPHQHSSDFSSHLLCLCYIGDVAMVVAAGGTGEWGPATDVPVEFARFTAPTGIAVADNNDVFIADRNNKYALSVAVYVRRVRLFNLLTD
jgi:hypothetical protein